MAQVAFPKMAPLQGINLDECEMKHVDVQIENSPVKFYNTFRKEAYGLPEMSTEYIKSVTVKKGDWQKVGSEKEVTYYPKGKTNVKTESFSDRLVRANESAKSVTYQVLEGKIMEDYDSFVAELVVNNLNGCNWARWTVAYKKKYDDGSDPDEYLALLEKVSKDVDAHLPRN